MISDPLRLQKSSVREELLDPKSFVVAKRANPLVIELSLVGTCS